KGLSGNILVGPQCRRKQARRVGGGELCARGSWSCSSPLQHCRHVTSPDCRRVRARTTSGRSFCEQISSGSPCSFSGNAGTTCPSTLACYQQLLRLQIGRVTRSDRTQPEKASVHRTRSTRRGSSSRVVDCARSRNEGSVRGVGCRACSCLSLG